MSLNMHFARAPRSTGIRRAIALTLAAAAIGASAHGQDGAAGRLPAPAEMAASLRDVWGERSLLEPDGPSFEFFRDLLPPLRYVNTAFRHYPVVLSTPAGPIKSRWVSNGSGVNLRADKPPMWKEAGIPVSFHVGRDSEPFGAQAARLDGPRYAEGHLPIVRVAYRAGETTYDQEAFAPVSAAIAADAAVFVRFSVRGAPGTVAARVAADSPITASLGQIKDRHGNTIMVHNGHWMWDPERRELRADIEPGLAPTLAVLTRPAPAMWNLLGRQMYPEERAACVERWSELLAKGMRLSIPEPIVQDAWRSLVIGNFLLADGHRMNYSAGNAYDHLYEAECGDAVRSLMLFGFTDEAHAMVGPLLDFHRQATRFHVAGHKLQLLAHYYWVTRDADCLRATEPVWGPVVDMIRKSRRSETGLLPPDRYAGDIAQNVDSLSSNSSCWRGLRDMAAVLADMGEARRAGELERDALSYREAILRAVARSEQRDVDPPFIPNALFGVEKAYPTLTATRMGSYYDLMAPYIIGSGVLGPGSEREGGMIRYLQEHGGIAMGMIRSMPHQGEFQGQAGVNVLYGLRYMLALLRRDDRGRALVGFYGQLAQAMTRGTFIGGEGSRFFHGDELGRSFYLPPNSASNAMFLTTLRYLLVQDWDLDDDGRPETLRLLYGAPGRWLRDGAVLEFERAPTAFGPVSLRAESRLAEGEVRLTLTAPPRPPQAWMVRLPLPAGWKAVAAKVNEQDASLGRDGAIDLTSRRDRVNLRVRVEKQ